MGTSQVARSSKNEKRGSLPNIYVNADWGNFKMKKPIPFSFGSNILVNGYFVPNPNPYRRQYVPPPPPPPPNSLRNPHLVRCARKNPASTQGKRRRPEEIAGEVSPLLPPAKRLRRFRDILHDELRWSERKAHQKYSEGSTSTSIHMTRESITGDSLGNYSTASTSTLVDSSLGDTGMQDVLASPLGSGSKKTQLAPFPLSFPPSPPDIPYTQDEFNSSSFFSPSAASFIGTQKHPIVLPETQDDTHPFEEFLRCLENSLDE